MSFSQQDFEALSGLYIQPAWFAHVDFPSGERRLHTGMGPVEIGGHEWEGVSDPFGGQLVGLGAVEEPYFGQAPAVDVVMSGANREFLKSVWDDRHAIEGCSCDLYFATFDAETGEPVVMFRRMMQGRLTAPRVVINGPVVRAISLKIVGEFEGLNFPTMGSMWSPTGQRQRHSGDKGLDYINADVVEVYKP
ncbi:MAG: transcriptional regulator [Hyphomicrobiales bacterium]|nr:MAG: transcriptional regulator [Hyphomicrobiales bacterium]